MFNYRSLVSTEHMWSVQTQNDPLPVTTTPIATQQLSKDRQFPRSTSNVKTTVVSVAVIVSKRVGLLVNTLCVVSTTMQRTIAQLLQIWKIRKLPSCCPCFCLPLELRTSTLVAMSSVGNIIMNSNVSGYRNSVYWYSFEYNNVGMHTIQENAKGG